MKRIALFWPYFLPQAGAAAVRGWYFAKYLGRRYEVEVVAPGRRFSGRRPDVVIGSYPGGLWSFYGWLTAARFRADFILDLRDLPKNKKLWVMWLYWRAKKILVETETQKIMLRRFKEKIILVPNGVDFAELAVDDRAFDKSDIDVVYLGNINENRDFLGLSVMVRSLKVGRRFLFIGYDKKNPFESSFVRRLGVDWLPEIDFREAFKQLQRAKIGLVTISDDRRLDYQLPVKVFEYLAAGLAVAALVPEQNKELRQFMLKYSPGIIDSNPMRLKDKIEGLLLNEKQLREISRSNLELSKKFNRCQWMESLEF